MIILLKHGVILSFKNGYEMDFMGDANYVVYAPNHAWIATISKKQFVACFARDEDYIYSIGQQLIRNVGESNDSSVRDKG